MNRKWWTLGIVSVATFMLLLDITIVNVALPSIEQELDASFTDLQWVIDAYALTLAAFVLTAGSIADRVGRKVVFIIGLVIFSVSSLAAGLSGDPTTLNIARAVQGLGGAIMFAVSLALIAQEFPPGRERGMAMGVYGATIGAAVAIGPMVGGALTDGLGWEWIFFINVPIGVVAAALSVFYIAESRDPNATRIDWWGQTTFSISLLMLVLALLRGNEEGWGSALIVGLFAGSAALMAAFVAIESRVREPMLPLRFFKIRSFTGVQLAAFGISGSMFALFLYLTLYMQNYLGLTAFETGLRYLPITMASFFVAPVAGALIGKVQARYMLSLGLALAGIGLMMMGGITLESEWTTLLGGFLVAGAGIGLLNPVIAEVAVSVVPSEQSGMAAGINDTFRQVGIAVGIALWGALFIGTGADVVERGVENATASAPLAAALPAEQLPAREIFEASATGGLQEVVDASPQELRETISASAAEGFIDSMNEILLYGALLAFAGSVLSLALVREEEIERGEDLA